MELQKIKNTIPHGGIKEIAKRAKIHYITAVAFFNGNRKVSKSTETTILNNTAKYLKELEKKNKKAKHNLTQHLKK